MRHINPLKTGRATAHFMAIFLLALFAARVQADYSAAVLNDSPLGYWRLGETAGSLTVNDSSGHGHQGTYLGGVSLGQPSAIPGDSNTSASFDGTSGLANIGGQPTFNLANNFTIEAWVKPDDFGSFRRIASTFGNVGGVTGYGYGFIDNHMVFTTYQRQDFFATSTTVTSQNWHHVAVTFDSANTATFYLDGRATQSIAGIGGANVGTAPLVLGAVGPPPDNYQFHHGGLDEVAFYQGALSAAQIQQHYAASRPWAAVTVKSLNTGIDSVTHVKSPDGVGDTQYVVAPGGTGGHVGEAPVSVLVPVPAGWLPDNASADSRWIALVVGPPNGHTVSSGTYALETTVDLTGFQASTAEIQGLRIATDNALNSISINGQIVFSKANSATEEFSNWQYFGSIGLGYFFPGINTIRFEVANGVGISSDMGLRIEGQVIAAVPEPATFALAVSGLLFFVAGRPRAR